MVPTSRALALRDAVRGGVEQAIHLLTPAGDIDLSTINKCFNVRANDIFIGTISGHLLQRLSEEMPCAMLRFTAEKDDIDDEALRSGHIDLFISTARKLGPEIRVQPLFTTRFVGIARANPPLFNTDVTAESLTRWGHINISRRGKSTGPIDAALAASGLNRHVALVVPTAFAGVFALHDSDLLLPMPEHLAHTALRIGVNVRQFSLPVALATVVITQSWQGGLTTGRG